MSLQVEQQCVTLQNFRSTKFYGHSAKLAC